MSGGSAQVDRLQEQMERLKLVRMAAELPLLLQEASKRELSYTDLLEELFSRELTAKQERHALLSKIGFSEMVSIDPSVGLRVS